MNRTCRVVVAAFCLTFILALPVAALPGRTLAPSWPSFFTALWLRLAPVLGISEKHRGSADPDGLAAPVENDYRGSADPDGLTVPIENDHRGSADPNG